MFLIDFTSFMFVGCIALAAAISAGFGKDTWPRISAVMLPGGVLGLLIGSVNILNGLDDMSALWPAFRVATLTLLYGAMVKLAITAFKPGKEGLLPSPPPGMLGETAVGIFAVSMISAMLWGGSLHSFIDFTSIGIVAVSLVAIFNMKGTMKRVGYLPAVTRILPALGCIVACMASGIVWLQLDSPRYIGPTAAVGLLTLLYANLIWVGSILIKPARSQRNGDAFQWGSGIIGIAAPLIIFLAIASI